LATGKLRKEDLRLVGALIATYETERDKIGLFMSQLLSALRESAELSPHVHSFKSRMKEPEHLREKLVRKMTSSRSGGEQFDIDPGNLLLKVTDLAGIRILHLYTRQIREIDGVLKEILREQQYGLREGPFARTWDDESRAFFKECGIKTEVSPTLYTSVHYIVESASRTLVTCEIQVRTLMEEVWGEVDHLINYPVPTQSLACREQLKVLARVTSSATRLVDSIFLTSQNEGAATRGAEAVGAKGRKRIARVAAD
jgi:ppGpp synthetase/RelA/SpoT-type nucleotidyltranferase